MRSDRPLDLLRRRAEAADLAGRLPALQVEARQVANGLIQGVHGRRRPGPGETFWQFRPYQPGDPAQRVDWRQSARGARLFVREREWEAAQAVWLWCDRSPSMAFRSTDLVPRKLERAAVLTLAIGDLLVAGGERIGMLGHADRPSIGRFAIEGVARALGTSGEVERTSPPEGRIARHSRVVLVGDFLQPHAVLERWIEAQAARGVTGCLVQVADPAEESFPYSGRVLLEGLERDGDRLVENAATLAERYRTVWAAHRASLADLARRRGWVHLLHRTDQPPSLALVALWQALSLPARGSA